VAPCRRNCIHPTYLTRVSGGRIAYGRSPGMLSGARYQAPENGRGQAPGTVLAFVWNGRGGAAKEIVAQPGS
jgi:hypothetical protein